MAELTNSRPGKARLALRLEVRRTDPRQEVVRGPVRYFGADVLWVYAALHVGEREITGQEIVVHRSTLDRLAWDIEALCESDSEHTIYSGADAVFSMKTDKPGTIFASSYCNIHGLWESSKKVSVQ